MCVSSPRRRTHVLCRSTVQLQSAYIVCVGGPRPVRSVHTSMQPLRSQGSELYRRLTACTPQVMAVHCNAERESACFALVGLSNSRAHLRSASSA